MKNTIYGAEEGNTDFLTPYSTAMAVPWPFKKKTSKPSVSRTKYVTNVVEYKRDKGKEKRAAEQDKHLKNKGFLDAMKVLSKKEDD